MKLDQKSYNEIQKRVDQGMVKATPHPRLPYWIYNYTKDCEYGREWDEFTRMCRGLILDEEGHIISRPFPKFFNYQEHSREDIPHCHYRVFDKLDGVLGIVYFDDQNYPRIATRGSFENSFIREAERMLYKKYDWTSLVPGNHTYLFEIIYPEARIVLDYGDQRKLVFLGAIDNSSGEELYLPGLPFEYAQEYTDVTLEDALKMNPKNHEGFVLKFENGLWVKIKFEEYKRLHSILTGINTKNIWEVLSGGGTMDKIIQNAPDEFHDWINEQVQDLYHRYRVINEICDNYIEYAKRETDGSKKDLAFWLKDPGRGNVPRRYHSIIFAKWEGKDHSSRIWKCLKPQQAKFFVDG